MKNSLKALVRFTSNQPAQSKVVGQLLNPEQVELISGAKPKDGCTYTRTCSDCNHGQSCNPD